MRAAGVGLGMDEPAETAAPPSGVYDERGVDRSLVRWMLSLTPTQRLEALQTYLEQLAEFRLVEPHSAPR